MDNIPVVLQAATLGVLVAAPVGPVSILCIQRTLRDGFCSGLQFGLGIAMADAIFSSVAAFGLTMVMMVMIRANFWVAFIGGAYLFYLGYKTFRVRLTVNYSNDGSRLAVHNNLLTAFFVTITNPMTVMSFVAMFSGIAAARYPQNLFRNGAEFVGGIFIGSFGWWFCLSFIVRLLRQKIKDNWLAGVNAICSISLMLFGIYLVIKSAIHLVR